MQLYLDYLSQPSRAALITFKILNIPHTVVETRISKVE